MPGSDDTTRPGGRILMRRLRNAGLAIGLLATLACSTANERVNGPVMEKKSKAAKESPARGEAAVLLPLVFNEVWGYLMKGEERELSGAEPLTDIGYFSVPITSKGVLGTPPAPPALPGVLRSRSRVHLVITELSNPALTHFCLNPELSYRKRLVDDIVRASIRYDGVQVDFESVPADDAKNFLGFLGEIRKSLPTGKILSVALPPRRKPVADAYDYAAISALVDRVIIMAYDQHWRTSRPGPVGSVVWLREIIEFAERNVPRHKLVVGLPLYGRAWQDKTLARALRGHHIDNLVSDKGVTPAYTPESGCHFRYSEQVTVNVYYDDINSTRKKLELCRDSGIGSTAFWRIGQGSTELWSIISAVPIRPSGNSPITGEVKP
jgi:hypothetical protein